MSKLHFVAVCLVAATPLSTRGQQARETTRAALTPPPIVMAADAPPGTETLPVQWIKVAVPDLGAMRAAVARPPGPGPFPAVLVLHGTHGFARQYVEWARDLGRAGFIAVAACWFSGGGGAGTSAVTAPIPCPEVPPLGQGEYPETVRLVDALVQATRALPGARADRLALVGHSRGAGATQQYVVAGGDIQAAVLHSSGYALRLATRAHEFTMPTLIMHGTGDSAADGGSANTRMELAREFEAALRAAKKPVETAYCEGCGHNTFFTRRSQRRDELQRMIEFLRRQLGR